MFHEIVAEESVILLAEMLVIVGPPVVVKLEPAVYELVLSTASPALTCRLYVVF